MRTGLVFLGTIITVLGAGLILVLFFLSGGSTSGSQTAYSAPGLSGHSNQTWAIAGTTSGKGSITVSWTATAAANVSLSPAECVGPPATCPTGPPALSWTLATSGRGTVTTNSSVYILRVSDPGGNPLSFSAQVSTSYSTGSTLPFWTSAVIVSCAIALFVMGGIALFLGLFLPGGVYRDRGGEGDAGGSPNLPRDEPGSEGGPPKPS